MKISKRKARWLRDDIAANRCSERPGITHKWEYIDEGFTLEGAYTYLYECSKCSAIRNYA